MPLIFLLDLGSPPVIAGDDPSAIWRAATTARIQHPVGLRGEQGVIYGGFFVGLDIPTGYQRRVVAHPGT